MHEMVFISSLKHVKGNMVVLYDGNFTLRGHSSTNLSNLNHYTRNEEKHI